MYQTPSIFGGAWTILRSRWHVARNTFWRGKLLRKIGLVLGVIVLLIVSYALYRFSRLIVNGLQELAELPEARPILAQLGDLDRIFAAVPGLALFTFAVPLLLTSVSFALSTLYLSRDLDTLLVTPVPVRSVFLARFLEGLGTTYLTLFVLLLPALIGYGQALGYGPAFVIAVVVVLLLLPLLPVSIGTFLTMLLVRIIPPRRLRDTMALLSGLFGLLFYVGTQLLTRESTRSFATPETAAQILRLDVPWLPTSWGARTLIAAGVGDWPGVALFGALYALATLGLFGLCLVVAERWYSSGWMSLAGTGGGRVRRFRAAGSGSLFLRGPIGAIVRKDLRVLPRDLQQLSQLLLPLALSAFWVWRLLTETRIEEVPIGGEQVVADNGLIAIGLFVCVLIASHLGLTGLSREGRGYWLLHLAPLDSWAIVWAKWSIAFLPFPIIGTLFVALIGALQQPSPGVLLRDWLIIVVSGVGVAGITAGFGAAFPRLDWNQPRKMTSARAGCLGSILYFLYTGLMLALTIGAPLFAARFGAWITAAAWGVAVLLTVAALILPLLLGAQRLRKLEL